jgi:hypothetical protein
MPRKLIFAGRLFGPGIVFTGALAATAPVI